MPLPGAAATSPRFFIEVNAPFAVFGLNLYGFAPALMAGAMLVGFGQFGLFFVLLLLSLKLARKMATEDKYPNEVAAHLRHHQRYLVPGANEPDIPIRIRSARPVPAPVNHWLALRIAQAEQPRQEPQHAA